MRRIKLRLFVLFTLTAAVITGLVLDRKDEPRPYLPIDEIIRHNASDKSSKKAWEIHISPDIEGPFRITGDDWKCHGVYQSGPGVECRAWVDSGTQRRRYDLDGIPDASLLVIPLENTKDQATCLVMKR